MCGTPWLGPRHRTRIWFQSRFDWDRTGRAIFPFDCICSDLLLIFRGRSEGTAGWTAKVSASFVIVVAFDHHFESPTLPSLFILYYIVSSPLHSLRWSHSLFYVRISPQYNTRRIIGGFLAISMCVTHHDKTNSSCGDVSGVCGRENENPCQVGIGLDGGERESYWWWWLAHSWNVAIGHLGQRRSLYSCGLADVDHHRSHPIYQKSLTVQQAGQCEYATSKPVCVTYHCC